MVEAERVPSDAVAEALERLRREACEGWLDLLEIGRMSGAPVVSEAMLAAAHEVMELYYLGWQDGGYCPTDECMVEVFWAMVRAGAADG